MAAPRRGKRVQARREPAARGQATTAGHPADRPRVRPRAWRGPGDGPALDSQAHVQFRTRAGTANLRGYQDVRPVPEVRSHPNLCGPPGTRAGAQSAAHAAGRPRGDDAGWPGAGYRRGVRRLPGAIRIRAP